MAGKVPGTPNTRSITRRDRSSLNEDQRAALLSLYDALASCGGQGSSDEHCEG